MRAAVDVPILANMTEFGKSELFTVDQLRDVGVNMVIYPVSLLRIAMGAAERGAGYADRRGSPNSQARRDADRADLYELSTTRTTTTSTLGVFNFQIQVTRHRTRHSDVQRGTKEHQHDRAEIKKGLAGVVVDYTAVSKVNPETNSLLYRGYPVQELARLQPFEEVAYLLWHGELPDRRAARRVRAPRARRTARSTPTCKQAIDAAAARRPPDGRRAHRGQRSVGAADPRGGRQLARGRTSRKAQRPVRAAARRSSRTTSAAGAARSSVEPARRPRLRRRTSSG